MCNYLFPLLKTSLCMCIHICEHMCVCIWRPETDVQCLSLSPFILLRQGLLVESRAHNCSCSSLSTYSGDSISVFQRSGITGKPSHPPSFFLGSRGQNSGFHTWAASIITTKSSPQPSPGLFDIKSSYVALADLELD